MSSGPTLPARGGSAKKNKKPKAPKAAQAKPAEDPNDLTLKNLQAKQAAMQSAMQSPQAQAQMAAMSSFMKNPQVQARIKELEGDPELEVFFQAVKTQGPAAIMQFWNDPAMLKKIGAKLGPMAAQHDPNMQQAPPEIQTLLDAARYGDLESAKELLEVGEGLDLQDDAGRAPLHCSVLRDQLELLQALVQRGANINLTDAKDNTPLHYAAGYGRLACIAVLLDAGADTSKQNSTGKTAFDLATADSRNPASQDKALLERLKV